MIIGSGIRHLFVRAMHLWVFGFLLACLPLSEDLWIDPVSPPLEFVAGPIDWMMRLAQEMPTAGWYVMVSMVLITTLLSVLKGPRTIWSFIIWAGYAILISRGWMVSTGGQQLIAIMLLLSIPMSVRSSRLQLLSLSAAWAARMQLVLAYLSTFLHKLQGEDWVRGEALTVLSTDPTFHYWWLEDSPMMAAVLTYTGLVFQLFFPVGIWFRRTRIPVIMLGVAFHSVNGIGIEIPDMSIAFILCYTIWLTEDDLDKVGSIVHGAIVAYIPSLRR